MKVFYFSFLNSYSQKLKNETGPLETYSFFFILIEKNPFIFFIHQLTSELDAKNSIIANIKLLVSNLPMTNTPESPTPEPPTPEPPTQEPPTQVPVECADNQAVQDDSDFCVGMRVVRGPDWKYNNQDEFEGQPGEGLIIEGINSANMVKVEWDNGDKSHQYRVGGDDGRLEISPSPNAYAIRSLKTPGTKVVRGPDWEYNDQDGLSLSNGDATGKVLGPASSPGWTRVRWDRNGSEYRYRIGAEKGKFDIVVADEDINWQLI